MMMHARPGDKELYMLTKPGSSTSDAGIVANTLGDARVKAVNGSMSLTPITGVRTWLEAPPPPEGAGAGAEPIEEVNTGRSLVAPTCPLGQVVGSSASAIGRCTS